MVEQIYDINKLKNEIKERHPVSIQLSEHEIKEWKDSGKFAHLKKELAVLPKMKFSCTKLDNGDCVYYFIPSTKEMMNRICNMLHGLLRHEEKIPLVKCDEHAPSSITSPRAEGSTQSCTLF